MKSLYLAILILFNLYSCKEHQSSGSENIAVTNKVVADAATIEVVDFEGLMDVLNGDDEKTFVINFWATWCKPCIAELPAFEKLKTSYAEDNVEVILVSLDFKSKVQSDLIPFIKKRNIASRVILMDDPNENEWLPKIDMNWSGAIPATLIKKGNEQSFYEQSFDYEALERSLNSMQAK